MTLFNSLANNTPFHILLPLLLIFPIAGWHLEAQSPTCPIVTSSNKDLVEYVRRKFTIPGSVNLSLREDASVPGTCFRKLTFHGKTDFKEWDLSLYISPDRKFLFSDLFDTRVDPVDEELRKSAVLMAGLSENKSASQGPDSAVVTIVEFSDFECPYCKKFADILKEALRGNDANVRLVFHHMPLRTHLWAKRAAEGAACAQLQNKKAFWEIHDGLFAEQDEITALNIDTKMNAMAASSKAIDPAGFKACLESEMSLGLVYKDINLASSHAVNATPTVFINGRRASGLSDIASLRKAISEAKIQSQPSTAADAINDKIDSGSMTTGPQ